MLLHVSDSWLKAIDTRQYVGAIFLDLAKAFNCVNHDILLQKLDRYGIREGAYGWMKSFLSGRTQQVCAFIQRINYYWSSSRVHIKTPIVLHIC